MLQRIFTALLLGVMAMTPAQPPPDYYARTVFGRTGTATYYDPGVMDATMRYHFSVGLERCHECIGGVATLRAGDSGRKVMLQRPGQVPIGPFLVVDCATPWDYERLKGTDWVVDVPYSLAAMWDMRGPLPVTITDYPYAD